MIGRLALILLALTPGLARAQEGAKDPTHPKKVLVELYTSQGCNSCPSANEFLGQLGKLGYGPERVVPIAFHVDYFNTPWVDPFSSPEFSRRERAYNSVLKRDDLYFTPMMMVDGRTPMLGSNQPVALKAIKGALATRPGVALRLSTSGTESDRTAEVEATPLLAEAAGRPLMVALALTEGPVTTKVPSGENAGSSLVEPAVVRSFAFRKATLEASKPQSFAFPVKLPAGGVAANCRISAFVQDWDDGRVHQAESIRWTAADRR